MTVSRVTLPGLPDDVLRVINHAMFTEWATLTAKGVALDTPLYCFPSSDGTRIDVATGLGYPAKAERARRDPRVGLLIEGPPGEPVVSIAALAAVCDSDIQANVDRYLAETAGYVAYASGVEWSTARKAIWYWSRIIISSTPKRILWWKDSDSTDQTPERWLAPESFTYPDSDPAPAGKPSPAARWPVRDWPDRAHEVLEMGLVGHLTLCDEDGFPLPFRTRSATVTAEGFELEVPAGAPWHPAGSGSLCFNGLATFVGQVEAGERSVAFRVERMLPDLPMVQDPRETFAPKKSTREPLMERLHHELSRRGLGLPRIPGDPPAPTEGALMRQAALQRLALETTARS